MKPVLELPAVLARRRTGVPSRPAPQARLTRDRIYILPTPSGLLFASTTFLMLLASINYGLGLGFALTFLLAGVGVAAMLLTHRNLAGIDAAASDAPPVFCGSRCAFTLELRTERGPTRVAIDVGLRDRPRTAAAACLDVTAGEAGRCLVQVEATARGSLQLPALRVSTTFPLGLFRAWSNVQLAAHCTVYPRPEDASAADPCQPEAAASARYGASDDLAGLRDYVPGDAIAHVAWTALARGSGLVTKQFHAHEAQERWLRWEMVFPALPTEQALSRLTRSVLELDKAGVAFGLDIPGCRRMPERGPAHVRACLHALAHFGKQR